MRDEYPGILKVDSSAYRDSLMLATGYIFEAVDSGRVTLVFKEGYRSRVAYHVPCHMEKLGWGVFSASLMKLIPGLEFIALDSSCCGIAGTYGFKKENYEASQEIGAPLFRQISAVAPDVVATDCETCKWQIEMSTGLPVENPISVLADALDIEATRQANLISD
jgi:glycerol-3-phosphate dehydrogenase subunit C